MSGDGSSQWGGGQDTGVRSGDGSGQGSCQTGGKVTVIVGKMRLYQGTGRFREVTRSEGQLRRVKMSVPWVSALCIVINQ